MSSIIQNQQNVYGIYSLNAIPAFCTAPWQKAAFRIAHISLSVLGYIPGLSPFSGLVRATAATLWYMTRSAPEERAFAAVHIQRGILEMIPFLWIPNMLLDLFFSAVETAKRDHLKSAFGPQSFKQHHLPQGLLQTNPWAAAAFRTAHLALLVMGYIPGISVITGSIRAGLGLILYLSTDPWNREFGLAHMMRGALEALPLFFIVNLFLDGMAAVMAWQGWNQSHQEQRNLALAQAL